eukprot:COSAG06_NODE_1511_length_9233_cov_3.730896_7_plen_100_part_00
MSAYHGRDAKMGRFRTCNVYQYQAYNSLVSGGNGTSAVVLYDRKNYPSIGKDRAWPDIPADCKLAAGTETTYQMEIRVIDGEEALPERDDDSGSLSAQA